VEQSLVVSRWSLGTPLRPSANDHRLTTNDSVQEESVQQELHHARSLGLGAALGAATGHMGVWVAAGIAAYIAISLVGGAWSKRPND
jgi:hypothetical protein